MATATEAPASITAEGPTSHTQNQARLSSQQIDFLLRGISDSRVGKDGKGFAHVEAWDIRRHMIRVFGFGGFDTDLLSLDLVAQVDIPPNSPNGKVRYTVVYRAAIKLTVKVDGVELGHWHGAAIGDATNQPGLADAHDLALKTADSQALKRAAVNMGDQFGLSLYNGGSLAPVVNRSLAYMKPEEAPKPVTDPPVRPEPTVQQSEEATPTPEQAPTQPTASAEQGVNHLDRLMGQARDCYANPIALTQILADAEKHKVADEEVDTQTGRTTLRALLDNRISFLNLATANGHSTERGAA